MAAISIKLINEKAIKNRLSFVKKIGGFNNYQYFGKFLPIN